MIRSFADRDTEKLFAQIRVRRFAAIERAAHRKLLLIDRAITADTALRLAKYFGTSARLWLNLQSDYELRRVKSGDWAETEKRIRPLDAA